MRLELGNRVRCTDGAYGELADIVIDPLERRVTISWSNRSTAWRGAAGTHPAGEGSRRRAARDRAGMHLGDAQGFETVNEAAYIRLGESPAEDPDWDVGVEHVLAMPYYSRLGADPYPGAYPGEIPSDVSIYYDRVPKGEVEVRRASVVISVDGHSLGEVDGFVVDADKHITHFLLERGHLWGRKEVSIPIGAVADVKSDAVHVALSKDEVGALPAVRVGRHG